MSQVRPDIDLAGLARQAPSTSPPRRSPWRIILPVLILLVFLAVLASSLLVFFETKVAVSVIRPRHVESRGVGASSNGAARVVLQAAGWIEPDPFAIQVTALAPGVVREMLVVEAARVSKGAVVARLVDEDARLAVSGAEAALAQARAAQAEAEVRASIARTNFEQALAVTESEAVARAELEGRRAEVAQREAAARKGEAGVRSARDEAALLHELESKGATEERAVDLAEARVAEAGAALDQLSAEVSIARAEEQKSLARYARAKRDLELRLEDKLALQTADAASQRAKAETDSAQVSLDQAQLRLARMEILAPSDGVVLERSAMPGSVLADSASLVCTLFDPAHLRVRVDVPQSEVSKLAVGGRAEIAIDARSGRPYHGEIVRVVEKADIQKVTLQVHVRVEDGDEWLRPEMLAQVRFVARPAAPETQAGATPISQSVEVPLRVVEDGKRVWIVDGVDGTARLREVELGAQSGDWVEVRSGLDISDKVIDRRQSELHAGDHLRVGERP